MATTTTQFPLTTHRPRILVVDDEPAVLGLLDDVVGGSIPCEMIRAATVDEAKKVLSRQGVELMVIDVNLPDGKGTELLGALKFYQPAASAILIAGAPS